MVLTYSAEIARIAYRAAPTTRLEKTRGREHLEQCEEGLPTGRLSDLFAKHRACYDSENETNAYLPNKRYFLFRQQYRLLQEMDGATSGREQRKQRMAEKTTSSRDFIHS